MKRREFMSLIAGPLAGHISSVVTIPPKPKRHRSRRQSAILLLVVPPANWQPASWRDIPPVTPDSPISIVDRYGPHAVGTCRSVAKRHNIYQAKQGINTWAIVACNDGLFHQGKEGGAL